MAKIISDQQIEQEANAGYKPRTIESGMTALPLIELGDREFELLSYLLIKHEISDGKHIDFTNITLMQGVGERGRDCVLYKKDKISGIVQCKKLAGRLSRPMLLKEIIKFLLFYLLDKSLIPNPKKFSYILFVAHDLSEPALMLLNSHKVEIQKEISSGEFDSYVKQVCDDYESFLQFRQKPPVKDVLKVFKQISLSYANSVELTSRIYRYNELTSLFFKTISIIDIDAADKTMRKALDDYGVRFLTDDDLKAVQERIGNIDEEHRVRLGIADFFGLSNDFFRFIQGSKFKELLDATAKVQGLLDEFIINYAQAKIHEKIRSEITFKLLYTGKIHQYTTSIAAPYLFQCVIHALMKKTISNKILPLSFLTSLDKDKAMKEIMKMILKDSELVMKGTYSHLAGSEADVKFKLQIFKHLHEGFNSIHDAEKQLKKDLPLMRPVLDDIEKNIITLISPQRTVIINDTSFIDNDEVFKKVMIGLSSLK